MTTDKLRLASFAQLKALMDYLSKSMDLTRVHYLGSGKTAEDRTAIAFYMRTVSHIIVELDKGLMGIVPVGDEEVETMRQLSSGVHDLANKSRALLTQFKKDDPEQHARIKSAIDSAKKILGISPSDPSEN